VIKRLPRVANLAPLKVVTEDSPHTTAAKRLSPTTLCSLPDYVVYALLAPIFAPDIGNWC
jgi:hypothetical protein